MSSYAIIPTKDGFELIHLDVADGVTYQRATRLMRELTEHHRIATKDYPRLVQLAKDLRTGAEERSQSHTDVIVKITDVIGL